MPTKKSDTPSYPYSSEERQRMIKRFEERKPQEYGEIIRMLDSMIERGGHSLYELLVCRAEMHQLGQGGPVNYPEAARLYKRALDPASFLDVNPFLAEVESKQIRTQYDKVLRLDLIESRGLNKALELISDNQKNLEPESFEWHAAEVLKRKVSGQINALQPWELYRPIQMLQFQRKLLSEIKNAEETLTTGNWKNLFSDMKKQVGRISPSILTKTKDQFEKLKKAMNLNTKAEEKDASGFVYGDAFQEEDPSKLLKQYSELKAKTTAKRSENNDDKNTKDPALKR